MLKHKDKITDYFELSYASWLVMPRVLMEAMPDEWQERFVAILQEFDGVFDRDIVWKNGYPFVRMKDSNTGKFISLEETHLPHYRHPSKDEINYFRRNDNAEE